MPRDVLHDHDGVVHNETCGDRQGHERQIVQAVAAEIHHRERADKRNGHGHSGHQSCAAISQKDEDYDDHETDRDHQGPLDVFYGSANRGGAVQDDGGVDSLGNRRLDRRQFTIDAIDSLNDIGAGLPENDEHDGALAIEISGGPNILYGVNYVCDVREVNGRAVVIANDNGLVVFRVGDLVVCEDVSGDVAVGNLSFGEIGVLNTQHGLDVGQGQAVAGEFCGVDLHAHGWQSATACGHLADALNLRQFLLNNGGSLVVELVWTVFVGRQANEHDG